MSDKGACRWIARGARTVQGSIREISATLYPPLRRAADAALMNATLRYNLGPATDLDAARPTTLQLQRAQLYALRSGDRRRATAYALVVQHRLAAAQHAAAA